MKADAVIVSDYGKGLLTPRLLKEALATAHERGVTVCLDPKMRSFSCYQPVTVITPNAQEAGDAAGVDIESDNTLVEAGQKLLSSIDCRAVLITRGEEGMALFTDEGEISHIPTVAREVYDVTGAGDTVIAALALALSVQASFVEAAILANHAAGVVVGKVGTATVTCDELFATFD
jgi:D-beta-D-heptose 7-phosphate kinase/D-beta-D-heptose 1-phosphate adenosyltransferase